MAMTTACVKQIWQTSHLAYYYFSENDIAPGSQMLHARAKTQSNFILAWKTLLWGPPLAPVISFTDYSQKSISARWFFSKAVAVGQWHASASKTRRLWVTPNGACGFPHAQHTTLNAFPSKLVYMCVCASAVHQWKNPSINVEKWDVISKHEPIKISPNPLDSSLYVHVKRHFEDLKIFVLTEGASLLLVTVDADCLIHFSRSKHPGSGVSQGDRKWTDLYCLVAHSYSPLPPSMRVSSCIHAQTLLMCRGVLPSLCTAKYNMWQCLFIFLSCFMLLMNCSLLHQLSGVLV